MSIPKSLLYFASAILIMVGFTFLCGSLSESGKVTWALVGALSALIGLGLLWSARRRSRLQSVSLPTPVQPGMPPGWEDEPKRSWRKLLLSVLLGFLLFCILMTVAGYFLEKPKTTAVYYQNASILPMLDFCEAVPYKGIQPWMKPVAGEAEVLESSYSKPREAYTFYIQLDPGRVKRGTDFGISSGDATGFLILTRGSETYCSADLKGSLKILSLTDTSMHVQLDIRGPIQGFIWEYNQEIKFRYAFLPK